MTDANTGESRSRRRNFLVIGIAFAAGFWGVEAAIHLVWLDPGNPAMGLFPSDPNELWMRSLTSALFVAFGLYAQRVHDRLLSAELRLQDALRRLLSGYVPICAWCKKIRNDEGDWIAPEAFLETHPEVALSHGVCSQCESSHFPAHR